MRLVLPKSCIVSYYRYSRTFMFFNILFFLEEEPHFSRPDKLIDLVWFRGSPWDLALKMHLYFHSLCNRRFCRDAQLVYTSLDLCGITGCLQLTPLQGQSAMHAYGEKRTELEPWDIRRESCIQVKKSWYFCISCVRLFIYCWGLMIETNRCILFIRSMLVYTVLLYNSQVIWSSVKSCSL